MGLAICWMYGRLEGIKKGAIFVLSVSLVHGGGELIVSQFNQSIAAFIPATGALAVVILLSKLKIYRQSWIIEDSSIMTEKRKKGESGPVDVKTGVAFAPYVVLIAVTILLLVVTPVNQFLGQVSIGFSFPQTQTGLGFVNAASQRYSPFYPLIDSGTVLLITCIISFLILKKNGLLKERRFRRNIEARCCHDKTVCRICAVSADNIQDHERHRTDSRHRTGNNRGRR